LRVVYGLGEFPRDTPSPVLALGMFDGVHLGHARVLGLARARAQAVGGRTVAVTFEPHPLEVLRPSAAPVLLTLLGERLALLEALGVDIVLVVAFDIAFSQMPAQIWMDDVLLGSLGAREIVAGSSYTFGHRREGTASRLLAWGGERGVPVHLAQALLVRGEPVSSSRIRAALHRGLVDEAADLLGRWYGVHGRVVAGQGRGRTIGVPTANLDVSPRKVLPGRGVYATVVDAGGRRYGGATNVGHRPTFGGTALSVETHLLGFDGDLRGAAMTLSFVRRVRDERAFSGPEELARQIRQDLVRVQELLAEVEPGIIR
jgi:riboflavin kinase/FMN adenylyltransferase